MPLPNEILETLPEELRGNESLSRFNSVEDLAKSFVETKSLVGQSIRIPPEEAGPEARNEFLTKLVNNAPEVMLKPNFSEEDQSEEFWKTLGKPDEYALPEGVEFPEEVVRDLTGFAEKSNLTKAQFDTLMTEMFTSHQSLLGTQKEQFDADHSDLRAKWGMAYDQRIAAAKRANEELYGGNRDFDTLPAIELEAMYAHDTAVTGKGAPAAHQPGQVSDAMTPDEANMRAAEILRRVMTETDLTQEEKDILMRKREKILVEFAGYDNSIEGLRAGF